MRKGWQIYINHFTLFPWSRMAAISIFGQHYIESILLSLDPLCPHRVDRRLAKWELLIENQVQSLRRYIPGNFMWIVHSQNKQQNWILNTWDNPNDTENMHQKTSKANFERPETSQSHVHIQVCAAKKHRSLISLQNVIIWWIWKKML